MVVRGRATTGEAIMTGVRKVRVQPSGAGDSRRLNLPKAWTDALQLKPGDVVDVLFDDVLVVIPHPSPQAGRVRHAMAEVSR
jgi:hypothetical protein